MATQMVSTSWTMLSFHSFPVTASTLTQYVVTFVLVVLTVVTLLLRVLLRICGSKVNKYDLDDTFMIGAVCEIIGLHIIQGLSIQLGVGHPEEAVGYFTGNEQTILRLVIAAEFLYVFSTSAIRMSLLVYYLRTFEGTQALNATRALSAVVIATTIISIMQLFCFGRTVINNPTGVVAYVPSAVSFTLNGMCSVLLDAQIMALPMYAWWFLDPHKFTTTGWTTVFFLGFLSVLVASSRIVAITRTDFAGDLTGTMEVFGFLSVVQPCVASIVVNLPTLQPIIGALGCGCIVPRREARCTCAQSPEEDPPPPYQLALQDKPVEDPSEAPTYEEVTSSEPTRNLHCTRSVDESDRQVVIEVL